MKCISFLIVIPLFAGTLAAQEAEQWCRFRGPNGQGTAAAVGLPVKWSETENIAWKTAIPGTGWSSPIVWNDRIFLTSTTSEGKECHVFALDRKTGKILWDKIIFTQVPEQKHPRNSYATPTPVTDGKLVYVVFAAGGFAALDFDGNTVWTKNIHYYSHHGLATSPILYKNLLIFAVNPSSREEPVRLGWQLPWDKSYLLALDKTTGEERWRGKRGMSRIGHSTPVIINVNGKDQMLSPAGDVVQSFNPDNGELIWTVQSSGEPAVPTAAFGGGLVFMANMPSDAIRGIKPDGKGDCTATHIAWEQKRNVPTMASFLYVKPCLYTACDNGSFSAYDAATGEFLWQKRLGSPLNSSPVYADGKIYVTAESGAVTVLKPNADVKKTAEVLATNEIGEQYVLATPAVTGNQLLLRTETELWCIGK
ncbi:MAG: PQQ-binding-like beta-propeller repeat protein [Planctomycetaceae bacterium]|nr:PQQ-binding-like beta-propeller repeat protein [Planctomycetaceae bacterium]